MGCTEKTYGCECRRIETGCQWARMHRGRLIGKTASGLSRSGRELAKERKGLGHAVRGFWVCGAGETLAEAACPPIPHAHRKRGKRCAQGNHVSRLRRGLHLIGSGVEYLSRTVRHRGRIDQGKMRLSPGLLCATLCCPHLPARRKILGVRLGNELADDVGF
jgi:hypothetical protein